MLFESFSLPFRFELHNALKRKRDRLAAGLPSHWFPFLKFVGVLYVGVFDTPIMSLGPRSIAIVTFVPEKISGGLAQIGDASGFRWVPLTREVDMWLSLVCNVSSFVVCHTPQRITRLSTLMS